MARIPYSIVMEGTVICQAPIFVRNMESPAISIMVLMTAKQASYAFKIQMMSLWACASPDGMESGTSTGTTTSVFEIVLEAPIVAVKDNFGKKNLLPTKAAVMLICPISVEVTVSASLTWTIMIVRTQGSVEATCAARRVL